MVICLSPTFHIQIEGTWFYSFPVQIPLRVFLNFLLFWKTSTKEFKCTNLLYATNFKNSLDFSTAAIWLSADGIAVDGAEILIVIRRIKHQHKETVIIIHEICIIRMK